MQSASDPLPRPLTPYPPVEETISESKEGSDRDATDDEMQTADEPDDPQRASEPELEEAASKRNRKKPRAMSNNEEGDDGEYEEPQEPAPVKPKAKRVPRQKTPPLETKGASYEAAIAVLRKWLSEHLDDPYPDADQKQWMSEQTGLTYGQVQHWFINARMRYLRPMIAARKAEMEAPKQPESDLPSVLLSALTSVATHAAPLETAAVDLDAAQAANEAAGPAEQTVAASAAAASSSEAASSSPVAPRSTLFDLSRTLLSLSEFAPISDGAESNAPPRKSNSSATKLKPKPQPGLSAAIFSNGQSKAGRVVKRKSTSLDEEQGADEEEGEEAAAGGGEHGSSDDEDDDDEHNKKRKGPRGVGSKVFDPKQRRSKLPLRAVVTLRNYFIAHINHPFPRDTDKASLAEECGLAFKQISDWFTNTRKRFWRPYADHLEREGCGLVAKSGAQACTCGEKKAAPAAAAAAAPEDATEAIPPLHSWFSMWN